MRQRVRSALHELAFRSGHRCRYAGYGCGLEGMGSEGSRSRFCSRRHAISRLRLGYNSGVAFSLFASLEASACISIFTSLLIAGLAWMTVQAQRDIERFGLALMIGGALGNLSDRLGDGVVTDFIDLRAGGWHFPTFNLADVAITSGVLLLLAVPLRDVLHRAQHGG